MSTNRQTISHIDMPIFIDEESSVLILGSFPSVKSREYGFYYGHKQNRFFRVLSSVFTEKEPLTIDERKAFLSIYHIALYDVIYSCSIEGSSDASIKDVVPIEIEDILNRYPNIRTVGINGKEAQSLFEKYLKDKIVKDIKIIYLASTSPANAKCSLDELVKEYKKLFEY